MKGNMLELITLTQNKPQQLIYFLLSVEIWRDTWVWFTPEWASDFQLIIYYHHPVEGFSRMEVGVCRGSIELLLVQQLPGETLQHHGRRSSRWLTEQQEKSNLPEKIEPGTGTGKLTSRPQVSEMTSSYCTLACQCFVVVFSLIIFILFFS